MKCHIVGAGDFSPASLQKDPNDLLIAADKGFEHLVKMGLAPDLFVGDGDSLGFVPENTKAVVLPCEKDDTDMISALRYGLRKGYREFHLYGALGGKRLSHTIANLQALLFLAEQGAKGILHHENYTVLLLEEGAHSFNLEKGFFSLFAVSENALLSIEGAKYPLHKETLSPAFPKGVSNEGTKNTKITLHEGKALLVMEP